MLQHLHPGREALRIVVRLHPHPRLYHRGTGVELLGHEVHRRAMLLLVRLERPPMGVQAGKFRQERGVDVQHPPS